MWPSSSGTIPTNQQGTTLLADATDDHALSHRQLGTLANSFAVTLGTTSGTNLLRNVANASDQLLVANSGGTLSGTITKGTFNNGIIGTPAVTGGTYNSGVFGTPTLKSPTFNGAGTASGTIVNGVYNAATFGTPTIQNPYLARAYLNAAGTVTTTTNTKVPIDTADYDPNSNLDVTTNHRYTAPVTGYYDITGQIAFGGNGTGFRTVWIEKNGAAQLLYFAGGVPFGTGYGMARVTGRIKLTATDYIELWCWQNSGGDLPYQPGTSYTFLEAILVST